MVRSVSLELRHTTAAAAMEGPDMYVSLLLHPPRTPWTGAPLPLVNISPVPTPLRQPGGRQHGGDPCSIQLYEAASTWTRPSPLLSGLGKAPKAPSPLLSVHPAVAHLWMLIHSSSSSGWIVVSGRQTADKCTAQPLLFFSVTCIFELACFLLHAFVFPKLPIVKYYHQKAASEGSKTVGSDLAAAGIKTDQDSQVEEDPQKHQRLSTRELLMQNIDYASDIFLIYVLTLSIFPGFLSQDTGSHGLTTWYTLVLIAMYNVLDLIGRYLPLIKCLKLTNRKGLMDAILEHFLFIPAFYVMAKYGDQGVSFMIIPNMLKNTLMFKRLEARIRARARPSASGVAVPSPCVPGIPLGCESVRPSTRMRNASAAACMSRSTTRSRTAPNNYRRSGCSQSLLAAGLKLVSIGIQRDTLFSLLKVNDSFISSFWTN